MKDFVPNGSFVNVADFGSTRELAAHLKACLEDEGLYQSYHDWRRRPLPGWFVEKFNHTRVTTECRTCRYVGAMIRGQQWDEVKQEEVRGGNGGSDAVAVGGVKPRVGGGRRGNSRNYDREIWENTYRWIWSTSNPYFYRGKVAEGIGSPHTPSHHIWPLSIIARGLVDESVRDEMKEVVERTMVDGTAHESFHMDDKNRLTRRNFLWPNSLYREL